MLDMQPMLALLYVFVSEGSFQRTIYLETEDERVFWDAEAKQSVSSVYALIGSTLIVS